MAEPRIGAKMTLDATRFQAGLRSASMAATSAASRMSSAFAGLGRLFGVSLAGGPIAAAATLAYGIKRSGEEMSKLYDIANRSGVGFKEFQKLSQYFSESGIGAEEFGDALSKMVMRVAEAQAGNKGLLEALDTLGIKIEELNGLAPEDMFLRFADAIKQSGNSAEAMAASTKFFEESFRKMREAMSGGRDEIIKNSETIKTALESDVEEFKKAEAAWERFKRNLTVTGAGAAGEVSRIWSGFQRSREALGTNQFDFWLKKDWEDTFGSGRADRATKEGISEHLAKLGPLREQFAKDVEMNPYGSQRQVELKRAIDNLATEISMMRMGTIEGSVAQDPIGEGF